MEQQPENYLYSVVIPVFNSASIVGDTIQRTVDFFEKQGWRYEIILINDASSDTSWSVIEQAAAKNPHLISIDMLHNYGQHTAIYAGFHHAQGDYIITIDDDLQNPPEEIIHIVHKVLEGYDVVYGQFRTKQHAGYRRLGSRLIQLINQRIFHQPHDLILSNFRILHKDVVARICEYYTPFPYITGLSLMFSAKRANVLVEHHPRRVGTSNYNLARILSLVMRILFSYSTYPLHVVSVFGFGMAALAFVIGVYFFFHALIYGTNVTGWASLVILIAFIGGMNIVIASMVGEYVIRLVRQSTSPNSYHIRKIIKSDE